MPTVNADPTTYGLILAGILEELGWKHVGTQSHGARLYQAPLPSWVPDRWVVVVPVDPDANGYDTELNALLDGPLEVAYQRGLAAAAVFDRLRAAGIVT